MNLRPLGKTGARVSEVGFGAWAIGGAMWGGSDDAVSRAALHRALELGVTLIDTALVYGNGHSEKLVGEAIAKKRDRVYLCTKVPPKNLEWPARHDAPIGDVFPRAHLIASCERSLRHLGVEQIDLLQLHVWAPSWACDDEWWDTLQALKQQGKIRHVGISLNDHQPETGLDVIARERVDVVQVIYNMFDQSPEDALFPACLKHGVGVLARVPLDEGSLTGKLRLDTKFPPGDFRARYFGGDRLAETVARVDKLRFLEQNGRTMAQAALGFVLGHPAVSSVIPGMRNVRQVEENVSAAEKGRLSDDERSRTKQHRWVRDFY